MNGPKAASAGGDEEQRAAAFGRQEAGGHANHLRGDPGPGKAGVNLVKLSMALARL